MRLGDAATDGETEPRSATLAVARGIHAEEAVEQPRCHICWDTGCRVFQVDHHIGSLAAAPQVRAPSWGKAALRGLAAWRYRYQRYGNPWELRVSRKLIGQWDPRALSL